MRLLEWSLATFHTCFFFAVLILTMYLRGNLATLLAYLNTLVGTAIFLVFWAITWYCTRHAIRRILEPEHLLTIGPNEITSALAYGPLWGGINGVAFFLALLIPGLAIGIFGQLLNFNSPELARALPASLLAFFIALPFAFVIGAPVASIIGAAFGFLFALIDGLLIGVAQALAKVFIPDPQGQANPRLAEDPLGLTRLS